MNKTKALFDQLTADKYDVGDFNTFSTKLQDKNKAKALHEQLVLDKYDVGDFDTFYSKVGRVSGVLKPEQPNYAIVPEITMPKAKEVKEDYTEDSPISYQEPFKIPAMYSNEQTIMPDTKTGVFTPEIAAGLSGETNPIKTAPEKNSFAFDLVEKFNQGGANVGKNSAGFLQKIYGGLKNIPIPGAEWYYGNAEDAMGAISNYFGQTEKEMQAITDRYKGKDYSDLISEGNYSGAFGDIMLNATQSLPQSLQIMFMGPAGVAMGAAQMQNEAYDQLEGKDMSEASKMTNSILNAAIQTGTEYMNTIPMGKLMSGLARKIGQKEATTLLEKGTKTWLQKMFKKYGVYLSPVDEGIEEFVSQVGTNTTDYLTGAKKEFKPFEDAGNSFVYGAGGGLQFSAVGVPMQIASNVKAKKQYALADSNLGNIIIEGGFSQEEADKVKQTLLSKKGKDREDAISEVAKSIPNAVIEENGSYKIKPEIEKAFVDFYNSSDNLQESNSKHDKQVKQAQREAEFADIKTNATEMIEEIINPDMNAVVYVKVAGFENPVRVKAGNIVVNEQGKPDQINTDETITIIDENNVTHVIDKKYLTDEELVQNTPREQAVQEATDHIAEPLTRQIANEDAPIHEANEVVRVDNEDGTFEIFTIETNNGDGTYQAYDGNWQERTIEAGLIVNEDNLKGINSGDTVEYINEKGEKKEGTYIYDQELHRQGMVYVDDMPTPIELVSAIKTEEEVPETEQNGTTAPSQDNKVSEIGSTTETAPVELLDNNEQPQTTAPVYPTNKKGEPDFDNMTVEQTFNYMKEVEGEEIANEGLEQTLLQINKAILDNTRAMTAFKQSKDAAVKKAKTIQERAKITFKQKAQEQAILDEKAILEAQAQEIRGLLPKKEAVKVEPTFVQTSNVRPEEQFRREQEAKAQEQAKESTQVKDAKEIVNYGTTMGEAYDNIVHNIIPNLQNIAKEKSREIAITKNIQWIDLTEQDYLSIPEYTEAKRLIQLSDKMFQPETMNETTLDNLNYWIEQSQRKKRTASVAEAELAALETTTLSESEKRIQTKKEFDKISGVNTTLVGSTSRGEATENSDIDIVLEGMPIQGKKELNSEEREENSNYAYDTLVHLAKNGTITEFELLPNGFGLSFKFNGYMFQVVPNPSATPRGKRKKDIEQPVIEEPIAAPTLKETKFQKEREQRWGDVTSLRELILRQIIRGNKVRWNDLTDASGNVISRGLGAEYRYEEGERKIRWAGKLIVKDGLTPEQFAHKLWEENAYEQGQFTDLPLYGMDDQEILSEILDVYNSYRNTSEMIQAVEEQKNKLSADEQAYLDNIIGSEQEMQILDEISDDILASVLGITNFTAEQLTELENLLKGLGNEIQLNYELDERTETASEGITPQEDEINDNQEVQGNGEPIASAEEISGSSEIPNNQSEQPSGIGTPASGKPNTPGVQRADSGAENSGNNEGEVKPTETDTKKSETPNRFEEGKKLNKEQRKEVLKTMSDSYKVMNRPFTFEDVMGYEKRVWLDDATPYMQTSDITGRKLRYYITLPDGKIAHPTELYPEFELSEIKSFEENIEKWEKEATNSFKNGLNKIKGKEQTIYNILKRALGAGVIFHKEYNSSDVAEKHPLITLQFPKITNEYNPKGIIKTVQAYLNNVDSSLDIPKFDFDWEKFYNEHNETATDTQKQTQDGAPVKEANSISELAQEQFNEWTSKLNDTYKNRVGIRTSSSGSEENENFILTYSLDGNPTEIFSMFPLKLDNDIHGLFPVEYIQEEQRKNKDFDPDTSIKNLTLEYEIENKKSGIISEDSYIGIQFKTLNDAFRFNDWYSKKYPTYITESEQPLEKVDSSTPKVDINEKVVSDTVKAFNEKVSKGENPTDLLNVLKENLRIEEVGADWEKGGIGENNQRKQNIANLKEVISRIEKVSSGNKLPEQPVKQPWEMTAKERWDAERKRAIKSDGKAYVEKHMATLEEYKNGSHRQLVEKALSEGKQVPEEVLADYPELKAEVKPEVKNEPTNPKETVKEEKQTSPELELVTASTELATAKAKYDKAYNKYLDLKKKLENDPAFGMGGQTDIFGNVSGADNLFGNDGQKQAVEAVQAAKKQADDLKPAVDELQAKADKLREAVTNKILKQQEVKFEVKEETKFPRERVINAYSHMHMSPHNTATLEENWWNESVNDLKKTIKQYVPNILEEQLNSIIDKYKSDYLKNRESVWNAAKNTVSSAVAGRDNFNKKQADKRGSSFDMAEANFTEWNKKEIQRIENESGVALKKSEEQQQLLEKKENRKQLVKEARVKLWSNLKVGDTLDIGNPNGNPAISKKNKFSVETIGGAKWTLKEIYGIDHKEAQEIMDNQAAKEVEQKTTEALDSLTGGEYSKAKAAQGEKIEDFGEVIEGAKKHLATRNTSTKEDIASMPLSKSFPKPDFKQLVESGQMTVDAAIAMNYLYDNIPAKPRKHYRIDGWISKVQGVIDSYNILLENNEDAAKIIEKLEKHINDFKLYNATLKALGFPANKVSMGGYAIKQFYGHEGYSIVNGSFILGTYAELEDAAKALSARLNKTQAKSTETKLNLYKDSKTGKYFIGKKGATKVVRLIDGIETLEEARKIYKEQQPQLQQMWNDLKIDVNERRLTNRDRVGTDYRKGKDVTPEDFNIFGFRGVQFGNYVNVAERQQSLNQAYDALYDLANTLGISPKAISLNGELGMAFGARGSGGKNAFAAHYEPVQIVINLTKKNGAGSLAHEWWHALDNYFERARGRKLNSLTESPTTRLNKDGSKDLRVREEIAAAFKEVVAAIKNSGIGKRSEVLDQARTKTYWSTIVEMSARSFENFIIEKLGETGQKNDYLANFKELGEWVEDGGLDMESYPYPTTEETPEINKAFENLFNTIEEGENGMLFEPQSAYTTRKYEVSETGFYSTVEKALAAISQEKGTKDQFKAMLLKNGAKQAEMDWMGFDELPEKLTKADIQEWIDENRIEVQEVTKGASKWDGDVLMENGDMLADVYQDEKGKWHYRSDYVEDSPAFKTRKEAMDNAEADVLGINSENETKFSQYVLPGGENYKELLLTMPSTPFLDYRMMYDEVTREHYAIDNKTGKEIARSEYYTDLEKKLNSLQPKDQYKSSHFDEPNILAHVRFDERTVNGERVLFIEEIQSDFAQEGKKKGFKDKTLDKKASEIKSKIDALRTEIEISRDKDAVDNNNGVRRGNNLRDWVEEYQPEKSAEFDALLKQLNSIDDINEGGVPDMPFKKTDQWVNLAARRMMRYAAENGFARIAWANGTQQSERYDLSKQVDEIRYEKVGENYAVGAIGKNGEVVYRSMNATASELEDAIGKEITQKIVHNEGEDGKVKGTKVLSGENLKVGSSGMRAFYDAIVPSAMNKLGKPFGAKVENVFIPQSEEYEGVESQAQLNELIKDAPNMEQQSLPVTESMKKTASEGMPLFEPTQTFITFTPEEVTQEIELAHGSTELQKAATAKTIEAANSLIIKGDNLRGLHTLRNGRDTESSAGDLPYNITPAVSNRTVIKGYKEKGYVNFNGTKIEGHQDFADLWSIHRSPLIEKFHVTFLNANGEIVGTMAITSGRSDKTVSIPINEIAEYAEKIGATQVYLLHNHPSGNPTPSDADVNLTNQYTNSLKYRGIEVVGQVVVNHAKYSFIDNNGNITQHDYKTGEKPVLFTERESLLLEGLSPQKRMFEIAYNLLSEPSYKGAIIWLTPNLEIAASDVFPEGATKEDMIRIANEGVKKNLGSRVAFVHDGSAEFKGTWENTPDGTLDVIDTKIGSSDNFVNLPSPAYEKNKLWAHQTIGEYRSIEDVAQANNEVIPNKELEALNKKLTTISSKLWEGLADMALPVKKFQEYLESKGVIISDNDNYYMRLTAVPSRIEYRFKQFKKNLMKPLLKTFKAVKKNGFTYDDITTYLKLKHADEYTASKAAEKKITLTEDTDFAGKKAIEERIGQKAEDFIANFEDKNSKLIDKMWKQIRKVSDFTLDEEVRSGLKSKEDIAKIKEMFEYYVPLRGHRKDTAEDLYEYSEGRADYFFTAVKHGKGRKSESDDPLSVMEAQAESAIKAAEENILNQTQKRLASQDHTGAMTVSKTWFKKVGEQDGRAIYQKVDEVPYLDTDTEETYKAKIAAQDAEMEALKEKGEAYRGKPSKLQLGVWIKPSNAHEHDVVVKQNGVSYTIRYNTNPRIPQAINGANIRHYDGGYGKTLKGVGTVTRHLAGFKTLWRPAFILVTNPLRDIHAGINLAFIDEGAEFAAKAMVNLPIAVNALVRYNLGLSKSSNKYDRMMADYLMQGAKTGITKMLEIKKRQKDIEHRIKNNINPLGAVYDLYHAVSDITENQMRFAVYITAIEKGYSNIKATSMAKDATVNYDRKGNGRNGLRTMKSGIAFVNVGFQALDTIYSKSTKNSKTKKRAAIALAANIISPMLLMAGLNAIRCLLAGEDDDKWLDDMSKLSDFERNANFVIWTPKGLIKIPLAQEFRIFHGLGTDLLMFSQGKQTATQTAVNLISGFSSLVPYNPIENAVQRDEYNPISALLSTVDIVSPFVELYDNKDWLGGQIYKQNQDPNAPGYTKARTDKRGNPIVATSIFKLSKYIDEVTGGDGATKGWPSPNPDVLDHLLGGYFAGIYQQPLAIANALMSDKEGAVLEEFIPRAIWKNKDEIYERNSGLNKEYFDISTKVESEQNRIRRYIKNIQKDHKEYAETDPLTFAKKTAENQSKIREINTPKQQVLQEQFKLIDNLYKYAKQVPEEDQDKLLEKVNKIKEWIVKVDKETEEMTPKEQETYFKNNTLELE